MFSMLMNVVPESTFLDLYAGSGAVGLEAYSRGASQVTWVEHDPKHVQVLKANLALLAPDKGEVICSEIHRWLKSAAQGRRFDLVFADPPYAIAHEQGFAGLMDELVVYGVIAERGFFVAEMADSCKAQEVPGWTLLRDRTYGRTRIVLYRRDPACVANPSMT